MGKTYAGNTSDESVIPKKIYAGDASNHSVPCKVAYCGDGNGKSVEVYRNTTLPSEYQKVEYIYDSNATEYIDTGVYPNSDTRLQIVFKLVNQSGNTSLFGCSGNGINNHLHIISWDYDLPTPGSSFRYYYGNVSKGIKLNYSVNTIDINKNYDGTVYLNSETFKYTGTFSNMPSTYLLFAYHNGSTVTLPSGNRCNIYSFKAWQYGAMIRDMYPCYLKSDTQVVGMYDLIGNQYYGNSGTGIFYKGPNVN